MYSKTTVPLMRALRASSVYAAWFLEIGVGGTVSVSARCIAEGADVTPPPLPDPIPAPLPLPEPGRPRTVLNASDSPRPSTLLGGDGVGGSDDGYELAVSGEVNFFGETEMAPVWEFQ